MRAFGVKNCSKPSDLRNWEHKLAALAEHESKGARLTLAEEIYATELHAKNAAMDAAERQARQKAAAQQQAHEDASWVPHGARGGPTTHTAVRGPGSENKVRPKSDEFSDFELLGGSKTKICWEATSRTTPEGRHLEVIMHSQRLHKHTASIHES